MKNFEISLGDLISVVRGDVVRVTSDGETKIISIAHYDTDYSVSSAGFVYSLLVLNINDGESYYGAYVTQRLGEEEDVSYPSKFKRMTFREVKVKKWVFD